MRAFENHIQWSSVKEVCERLTNAGFQALLAGGCVRDFLMSRQPHDFDIATNATPEQVESLFPRSIGVGKAFGVIILPFEDFQLEVATFREDLEYKDGRRPEGVRFSTAEADARRRDFTVNALFYDIRTDQVLDFVGGTQDINRKLIRTVGAPDLRFKEDKLRLMRAVRFAAQLEFNIDPDTLGAIVRLAPEIRIVSRERIRDELFKLLKAENPVKGLKLMLRTGLLAAAFPAEAKFIIKKEIEWLEAFVQLAPESDSIQRDPRVLLALFFRPAFLEMEAHEFRDSTLKNLRLDSKLIEATLYVLREIQTFQNPSRVRRGEMIDLLSAPYAPQAEAVARVLSRVEQIEFGPAQRDLDELRSQAFEKSGRKHQPLLTGADVLQAGWVAGPHLGPLLREAYLLQLEGRLRSKDEALAWLKRQKRS